MGTYNGAGFMFKLYENDTNMLTFYTPSVGWQYSNYTILEDGQRKHVAYTREGSVGTFYVNGEAVATVAGVALTDGYDLTIGTIGAAYASNTYRFDGYIDEPRIYSRALSADEMWIMYNSNFSKYATDKWDFTFNPTGLAELP